MNNKVMANIFSGLAQTGAWGCFDEFNRIPVEVLSVVAGQYGAILDGIRAGKTRFIFEEEEINLKRTDRRVHHDEPRLRRPHRAAREPQGALPAALRRWCTFPDFRRAIIAEIELSARGLRRGQDPRAQVHPLFHSARSCSPSRCTTTGACAPSRASCASPAACKRAEPDKSELEILMRALRDSNLPKFVNADFGIFLGLVIDLFPKVDCPSSPTRRSRRRSRTCSTEAGLGDGPHPAAGGGLRRQVRRPRRACSVRHCVFVLGAAGSAKIVRVEDARSGADLHARRRRQDAVSTLNPKAVTSDDLYGYVHPVTKEPYDGVIAKIMRDFTNARADGAAQVGRPRRRHRRRVDRVDEHRHGRQQGPHARLQRAHPAHAVDAAAARDLAPAQRLARHRLARGRALPQRDGRRLAAVLSSRGSTLNGDEPSPRCRRSLEAARASSTCAPTLDIMRKKKWNHITPHHGLCDGRGR